MTRRRPTPPPDVKTSHLVAIPPALRAAVRDAVITPTVARDLAPYLHPSAHRTEDRVDHAARTIGKTLILATFTIVTVLALSSLTALAVWIIRTITG